MTVPLFPDGFDPRQVGALPRRPRPPTNRATGAAFFAEIVHRTISDRSSPPGRRVAAPARKAHITAQPAEMRRPGPTSGASSGSTAGPLPKARKRAGKGPSADAAARFRPRQTAGRAHSRPPEGAVGRGLICRHAARQRCVRAPTLRPGNPARQGWGLVGR